MGEFIKTIKKNERLIFIALPILMAVIFAFLPMVDVFDKATGNGIKLIFEGKGLGFARFCATMSLLLPIIAAVLQFVKVELPVSIKNSFNLIWTAASLVFVVLTAIALPDGVTLTWGAYLYILLAIGGIAMNCLPKL